MFTNFKSYTLSTIGVWPRLLRLGVIVTLNLFLGVMSYIVYFSDEFSTIATNESMLRAKTDALIFHQKLSVPVGDPSPIHLNNSKDLSLDFDQTPMVSILQQLANLTHRNLIISPSVNGALTLHLHHVSYAQALNALLSINGLSHQTINNIEYIATSDEIIARKKQAWMTLQTQKELLPLKTQLISLKYSKATDLLPLLRENLAPTGHITADARTNILLVTDNIDNLSKIYKTLDRLDIPVKQVLIQARIVSVDSAYEKELGVQFVASGISLSKLGNEARLDIALTAMESAHKGEIISAPKVTTADQQPAIIQSGEEIPYQESVLSGGTSTAFKKAVLSLQVVPQITPNKRILMTLKINQDKRGQAVNGIPAIDTREIQTQVLANNGETIALGGIFENEHLKSTLQIPYLGQIPFIGVLFRYNDQSIGHKELIIFITPSIMEE